MLLREYQGDEDKLGMAETFLLCLLDLPNYNLYIRGLIQMEEFESCIHDISQSVKAIKSCCETLISSESLKNFFTLTLVYGNFINSVSTLNDVRV